MWVLTGKHWVLKHQHWADAQPSTEHRLQWHWEIMTRWMYVALSLRGAVGETNAGTVTHAHLQESDTLNWVSHVLLNADWQAASCWIRLLYWLLTLVVQSVGKEGAPGSVGRQENCMLRKRVSRDLLKWMVFICLQNNFLSTLEVKVPRNWLLTNS